MGTTLDEIRKLRELVGKMTEGPWMSFGECDVNDHAARVTSKAIGRVTAACECLDRDSNHANAAGIAALRNAAPELLAWAEEAHVVLQDYEETDKRAARLVGQEGSDE